MSGVLKVTNGIEKSSMKIGAETKIGCLLHKYKSFCSFDISVRSTGWCRWTEGVLEFGRFGLQEKSDLGRRIEFQNKIQEIVGGTSYDFIAIEDVILGTNFKTTKVLIQLNPIIDDMMYRQEIKTAPIERIGNTVWKKYLKAISGHKTIAGRYEKEDTVKALKEMQFKCQAVSAVFGKPELYDVFDSIGIAVGAIIIREERDSGRVSTTPEVKLKTDLTRSYTFAKYTEEKVKQLTAQYGVDSHEVLFDSTLYRDVLSQFGEEVKQFGDDFIFIIDCPRSYYGILALSEKLKFNTENNKIIAYKRTLK